MFPHGYQRGDAEQQGKTERQGHRGRDLPLPTANSVIPATAGESFNRALKDVSGGTKCRSAFGGKKKGGGGEEKKRKKEKEDGAFTT